MLDDLKYIHERDVKDVLGTVQKQTQQLSQDVQLTGNSDFSEIQNIVYAGMGSSALAAELATSLVTVSVPFEIVRNYTLPAYVTNKTLVIAASYSGNTEEVISVLEQARSAGAQIAVITNGGQLKDTASSNQYLLGVLPDATLPRFGLFANVRALLQVLVTAQCVSAEVTARLADSVPNIDAVIQSWLPMVPAAKNQAKQIALESLGKSVVVYSGPALAAAARRWKIAYNENAKQVAWTGQIPEYNHNEFIGWTKQPVNKPYFVVELRSNLEHDRVQKRFEISERLLSGMRPAPEIIEVPGTTILDQLLWASVLGDFVSIYAALASGVNPAAGTIVDTLKEQLAG